MAGRDILRGSRRADIFLADWFSFYHCYTSITPGDRSCVISVVPEPLINLSKKQLIQKGDSIAL